MGINRIDQLQADYDRLCATLEPQLVQLSRVGDQHAEAMRGFFREARAAWESDDRAGAKSLSEQGHAAKARSEAANTDASNLRRRLHDALQELASARSTYQSAPIVYDTRLIGFEKTHGWSATTVQEFLKHLPMLPFCEIDTIEYQDVVDAKSRAGVTERLHDASHKVDIVLFRPRIELTGKEFNTYQAWTLVHEYAHVVLDRMVPKEVRRGWKDFHLERRKTPGAHWVSPLAETTAREDFAESFAAYLIKPSSFRSADPRKHEIMKKIYEEL